MNIMLIIEIAGMYEKDNNIYPHPDDILSVEFAFCPPEEVKDGSSGFVISIFKIK